MTFKQFHSLAVAAGLTAVEHTAWHWQLRGGGLIVNYYPTTHTVHANGTNLGRKCSPEEAIQIAIESSCVGPQAAISDRGNSNKYKNWKAKMIAVNPYCHYCRRDLLTSTATVDHIIPLSKGGTDEPRNWALSCGPCNVKKADDVPGKLKIVLENNIPNRKRQPF